jgi:acetyl esterase/lipase
MKKFLLFVLLLGIQFSCFSCTQDSISEPIGNNPLKEEKLMDVSYGDDARQIYDLYLPANRSASKTKVIALVHGGRYTKGDKKKMRFFVRHFQENNPDYAIVNINYVLADSVTPAFPNQILNIGKVINKLTSQKDELQILPEFALLGTSSGAHLSMMYAYVYDTEKKVKAVIDIVGPTDFTDSFYRDHRGYSAFITSLVDKDAYPADTDYFEVLSPALHVTQHTSPTILFYGDEDPTVPLSNAITLKAALNKAEVQNEYFIYNGGHFNWEPEDREDVLTKTSDFINIHLRIEK